MPNRTKAGDIEDDVKEIETRRFRRRKKDKKRSTSSEEDRIGIHYIVLILYICTLNVICLYWLFS